MSEAWMILLEGLKSHEPTERLLTLKRLQGITHLLHTNKNISELVLVLVDLISNDEVNFFFS